MMMTDGYEESHFSYEKMVESALRQVVHDALVEAAEHGLPGNHHFYITFKTDHPRCFIPDYLHERYPDEMTIILQHQFFGLEVGRTSFKVSLSFDGVAEQLEIPFHGVTVFADPSVNFALQFEPDYEEGEEGGGGPNVMDELRPGEDLEDRKAKKGQVVELDMWRRR